MAIGKRVGWVLVGVVIGGLASSSLAAGRMPQERPQRLVVTSAGGFGSGGADFIKDTKTGACWLMLRSRDDMSGALAPAPAASCEQ